MRVPRALFLGQTQQDSRDITTSRTQLMANERLTTNGNSIETSFSSFILQFIHVGIPAVVDSTDQSQCCWRVRAGKACCSLRQARASARARPSYFWQLQLDNKQLQHQQHTKTRACYFIQPTSISNSKTQSTDTQQS